MGAYAVIYRPPHAPFMISTSFVKDPITAINTIVFMVILLQISVLIKQILFYRRFYQELYYNFKEEFYIREFIATNSVWNHFSV